MIIVLKPHSTEEQLQDVVHRIEDAGLTPHVSRGEFRTIKRGERLRLTWQPEGRESPTTLQLTLSCPRNDATKTTLRFHHERLASEAEREEARGHWRETLEKLLERAAPEG